MNSASDLSRRRALAALVLPWVGVPNRGLAHEAQEHAAIKTAANFSADTWADLLREGPRPAAYVFTTTYCGTCPEVFELLHATMVARRQRTELAAVVMDAQGARALAHARRYTGVTRLYAFDGFEPEIRHAVDPRWRNITPYVVLLDRQGRTQRVIGPPSAAQLKAWLA